MGGHISGLINKKTRRAWIVEAMFSALRASRLFTIQRVFFLLWGTMTINSRVFFPFVTVGEDTVLPTFIMPLCFAGLTYLVLMFTFKRLHRFAKQKVWVLLPGVLMLTGTVLCIIWNVGFEASYTNPVGLCLFITGSCCIGSGNALLLIEWARVFCYLGPRDTLAIAATATLISAFLAMLLAWLPAFVHFFLACVIPLPLVYTFSKTLQSYPAKTLYEHGLESELKVPWKFMITALLHGLALGAVVGTQTLLGGTASAVISAAYAGAATLVLGVVVWFQIDYDNMIYRVGFSLMALGALLVACIPQFVGAAMLVQVFGFCFVHVVMSAVCSYIARHLDQPPAWVISCSTSMFMLGEIVGALLFALFPRMGGQNVSTAILFMVLVFILLFAAQIMTSGRNLLTGWGAVIPREVIPNKMVQDLPDYSAAINLIAQDYSLTAREKEVLTLLVHGGQRRDIAEHLSISEDTAKSHIRNIYIKTGVHTKKELMSILVRRKKLLDG